MDKLVGFARKKRLGDLLVDAGVISQDQLVKALQVQKTEKQGERLGVVLIDLGFTDEKQIVEALKVFDERPAAAVSPSISYADSSRHQRELVLRYCPRRR